MEVLAKALVIAEEKCFVHPDRAAQGDSKLIALKGRGGAFVEVVGSIERVVAQKLVQGSVELVGPDSGDNQHLGPGPLAVFRTVGIAEHIELSDSIHAQ